MSDWGRTTIGDVSLRVTKGTTPKMGGFTQHGVSFVKVESITAEGSINPAKLAYINDETNQLLARSILKADDLLFSIAGTIGRVARVAPAVLPANTNQALAIIRPDKSKVDVGYLLYCLRDKDRIQEALSLVVQSVQANLSLSELSAIEIPVPPISEQRAIAGVLGALDDKIASNNKIVATAAKLTEVELAGYVRRNAAHVYTLSDITELLSRGVAPKYSDEDDTMIVLNQKCVRGQRVDLEPARRTLMAKVRADKKLRMNDVLVNSTGQGTLGRVARWTQDDQATVDSHITIVRFNAAKADPVCAGLALLSMQETIAEMGEGSTGQTELSRIELGKLRISLPSPEQQINLGRRFASIAEMERVHLAENRTLAATRDALLPRLMSGRIRIQDAAKVLEKAGV